MLRRNSQRFVSLLLACSLLAGVIAAPLHHLLHHTANLRSEAASYVGPHGHRQECESGVHVVGHRHHRHHHGHPHIHAHCHHDLYSPGQSGHSDHRHDDSHDHGCLVCDALAAKMLPAATVDLLPTGSLVIPLADTSSFRLAKPPIQFFQSRAPPIFV